MEVQEQISLLEGKDVESSMLACFFTTKAQSNTMA